MSQKLIISIAIMVLAVCLVSGGCQPNEKVENVKSLKDLVNLLPKQPVDKTASVDTPVVVNNDMVAESDEMREVLLYFIGPEGNKLMVEKRMIPKQEGMARKTLQELFKGPQTDEYLAIAPEGTRLRDINIKPEGLCIIDLSKEATGIKNADEEKLMISAIIKTLGQFPSVEQISFMIEGQPVTAIGEYVDISKPLSTSANI
ncbi:MAG: GerMN domain-containing protein [Syntrophomonadaceae bacterium]|nr:GerMN domain-containing protein [Syntrophomonadaceae bacterium]